MSRPSIANHFHVSKYSGIEELGHDEHGNCTDVRVKLFCDQSVGEDDDNQYQTYVARFFGRTAQNFVEYVDEGEAVFVTGTLYVNTYAGDNGMPQTILHIWGSNWQFVRTGKPNASEDTGRESTPTRPTSSGWRSASNRQRRKPTTPTR